MINVEESEKIKDKFVNKLNYFIDRDAKDRKIIISTMIICFVLALIFTGISTVMIFNSYKVSNSVVEGK